MARSVKTTNKAAPAAPAATRTTAARAAKPPAAAPTPTPRKPASAAPAQVASKPTAGRGKLAAAPATTAIPARVPPPSKGELRAQIEKLEAANATLKAKSREANRAAKIAARRIAELQDQVAQLETAAAKPVAPVPSPPEAKPARRGRLGRSKTIDPGDAVPPGVAVQEPEPLDEEAQAARDALEEHLSGE